MHNGVHSVHSIKYVIYELHSIQLIHRLIRFIKCKKVHFYLFGPLFFKYDALCTSEQLCGQSANNLLEGFRESVYFHYENIFGMIMQSC